MIKTRVLFLCTGNSARSQMAEAFLRKYAGDRFEAYSAGLERTEINPFTIRVMEEAGISLEDHASNSLDDYMGKLHFGYLITVCEKAEKRCASVFPGMGKRIHVAFDDPAAFLGSEEDKLDKFREIRDKIKYWIKEWLHEQGIMTSEMIE
jgi:arsenate reductase